jgi:preprotein translocase subunit YajC
VESLPFFALILVAFYLLIIRPQRARAKAAQQLQASLEPGVEVMTTAGMFGTLTEIRDDSVVIEVSPGVSMRFAKAAIGRVVTDDAASDDDADTDDGSTDGTTADDAVEGLDDAQAESRRSSAAE